VKIKITVNKRNVSRKTFWQAVKNLNTIKRLYRAKSIHMLYNMPWGGREECSEYNISGATITI